MPESLWHYTSESLNFKYNIFDTVSKDSKKTARTSGINGDHAQNKPIDFTRFLHIEIFTK